MIFHSDCKYIHFVLLLFGVKPKLWFSSLISGSATRRFAHLVALNNRSHNLVVFKMATSIVESSHDSFSSICCKSFKLARVMKIISLVEASEEIKETLKQRII